MNLKKFSVIIPIFNSRDRIEKCVKSILSALNSEECEIIIVDDCSSDGTFEFINQRFLGLSQIRILRTAQNGGPGAARNIGLRSAIGEWVLFLDSDDSYDSQIFQTLNKRIDSPENQSLDLLAFNWSYDSASDHQPYTHFVGRVDAVYFNLPKDQLIENYLQLRMDNSAIYSAFRRKILIDNEVFFANGFHEDIDFMFKSFWFSRKVDYLNKKLYLKFSKQGSIVNTISKRHLVDFVNAYLRIYDFAKLHSANRYNHALERGFVATIATRGREIVRFGKTPQERCSLYGDLYSLAQKWVTKLFTQLKLNHTLYDIIYRDFVSIMSNERSSDIEKEEKITAMIEDTNKKRWSCFDLHHSVFLAPNEVRTCCKRFFVNNEMRGDVVLFKTEEVASDESILDRIKTTKKELYAKINKGEESPCDGCPFLEFKEWGDINQLEIKNISLEHHSVCNLKCSYCDDKYYGGKRPNYDVPKVINEFVKSGVMAKDASIVWGGGEPVLDRNFPAMISNFEENISYSSMRVLSNSGIYSEKIYELLKRGRITLYTSIDAGTEDVYKKIRGKNSLRHVFENLRRYAEVNPSLVTIKYIFTEDNAEADQIIAYAQLIQEYGLEQCNFQISSNFKEEAIAVDSLVQMVLMFKQLSEAGCRVIYFDELLRQRVGQLNEADDQYLRGRLMQLNAGHILADATMTESVVVWGAGHQASLLIQNALFFKRVKVDHFVDSTTTKIGSSYFGKEVRDPQSLKEHNLPVVIAAVQNYGVMYQKYKAMGLDEGRLISGLII